MKANFTPRNLEFNRAIEFLMNNPEVAKASPRWKQYGRNRLYLLLDEAHVQWDTVKKIWTGSGGRDARKSNPATITTAKSAFKRLLLVRIIAHADVIAAEIDNFKVAADLIGWQIVSVSKPIWNRGGDSQRCYIKVVRGERNG